MSNGAIATSPIMLFVYWSDDAYKIGWRATKHEKQKLQKLQCEQEQPSNEMLAEPITVIADKPCELLQALEDAL